MLGHGLYGELGYGNTAIVGDNETPASVGDVSLGELAVEVAAGEYHTCAVLVSGAVHCWGFGGNGQLGLGTTTTLGDNEPVPSAESVDLAGARAFSIAAGRAHTCAVLSGSVTCWGANGRGQLGLGHVDAIGDNESPIVGGPTLVLSP